MPRNVEIKAKVHNIEQLVLVASELCGSKGTEISQDDTFFFTDRGRLKLRIFTNEQGELIFYDRPDMDGPKLSSYSKAAIGDPESLKQVLSMALGVKGSVRKKRLLFIYNQTRIHVDEVEGLGSFMELEVVLQAHETVEDGVEAAEELLTKLGISKSDLVSGSYMDALLKQSTGS